MRKVAICSNCGETKPIHGRGLCGNCHRYWHTHKKMRPIDSDERKRRRKILHCINCGALREGPYARRGMCSRCYGYWRWSGGVMRPEHVIRRAQGAPPPLCANCRRETVWHGKLCKQCANYQYDHGKRRPARLWADSCMNCGKPHGDHRPRSGLCLQCRRYQYKAGKPRPDHLWGRGEHGWCDCGQPATRTVDIRIYRKVETMPVCESCYAEEMRQRAWYGDTTHNQVGVNQQHSTR